jgi:5'(3')-deoxyribonucleotidase
MSLRIAIDMDEVLADTLAKHLSPSTISNMAITHQARPRGKKIHDAVRADRSECVRDYPRAKGFFRDIPIMPASNEVLPLFARTLSSFHHDSRHGIPVVVCRQI